MEFVVPVSGALVELVVVVVVAHGVDIEDVLPQLVLVLVGVALDDAQLARVVVNALLRKTRTTLNRHKYR